MWAPVAVPLGSVTLAFAVPLAGTGDGAMLPVRRVPLVGSSSRKVTVCPVMKLVICPLRAAGSAVTDAGERLSAGALTVTAALAVLSAPRQLALAGVTRYLQVPAGTAASVQLVVAIVPEQAAPIACRVPELS